MNQPAQANQQQPETNTTKKFLVIRFSSIGDIVLTTPVVRCLKLQVPNASIHFLTKHSFKTLVEHNPYIDKLHLLQDDLDAVIQALKQEQFDYIIDLHHNLRTLKVKKALQVPSFAYHKLNLKKWVLTTFKINLLPHQHIVDRNLATLQSFGVINDGKGLDYFIPEKDYTTPNDIPTSHQFGYVAVVIGAALHTKKLPIAKLQQLCSRIQYPIILLGGKEDQADGALIAQTDDIKIYNACGKFNLNESAHLLQKAKLVITHDTGLMHIAAALKKPILSIWGNTIPAFGMQPYYGHATITQVQHQVQISCRPCSKIGYKKCPRGHFKCMQLQNIEKIAQDAHTLL